MQVKLTIPERLRDLRAERGTDLADVAAATRLSASALSTYENDERKDISHRAVIALASYYGVTADYILGLTEIKNHPNTELHELHLDNKTLDLLKSGEINNRLLCEMMTNDGFQRLMMDIVIYVDRIASMQVATLNAAVDAARAKLLAEQRPEKKMCTSAHWSWHTSVRTNLSAILSMTILMPSSVTYARRTRPTALLPTWRRYRQ